MKFFIKQKVLSLVPNFTIKNENGVDVFRVEGKFLSFTSEQSVFDMNNTQLATIKRGLFHLFPTFNVEIGNGAANFNIRKEFSFFKDNYSIEGLNWTVNGDFFAHEYVINDNSGRIIANISKEWFTWGDSYSIDVDTPDNVLYVICLVLAIDCVIDASRRS